MTGPRFGAMFAAMALIIGVGAIGSRALAIEEYSGAFQHGSGSPCNGVIGPGDLTNVKNQLISSGGNYIGCKPEAWDIGDQIPIEVYAPGDDEALPVVGSKGRFPDPLDAAQDIVATVLGCVGYALTAWPDPGEVNDGETIQMMVEDGCVNLTTLADWSVISGPCSVSNEPGSKGLVTAAEGCSNTSCVIQAAYGALPSDTATVNVINNETVISSVTLEPLGPVALNPGDTLDFNCTENYPDGCELSCDDTAAWFVVGCPASSINGVGLYFADPMGSCIDMVSAQEGETVSNQVQVNVPGGK